MILSIFRLVQLALLAGLCFLPAVLTTASDQEWIVETVSLLCLRFRLTMCEIYQHTSRHFLLFHPGLTLIIALQLKW